MIKKIIKKCIPSFAKKIAKRWAKPQTVPQIECQYILNVQHLGRQEGKTCLVTGATGAIGSAICLRMAIEGAIVGVCGRTKEKTDSIISQILKIYPKAKLHPVILDVLDDKNVEDAIQTFTKTNQHLDILINNAGGGNREQSAPLRNQKITAIDRVLETNLRGSMLCARIASSIMVEQKYGKIISMSSVMGLNGKENWSEYSASKAGILGLTKSLALELGEYNVTVNSVSPGMVQQTPFDRAIPRRYSHTNALKRYGYTDEVASLVAFLCSDEANYITGQNFVIDGGRSIGLK